MSLVLTASILNQFAADRKQKVTLSDAAVMKVGQNVHEKFEIHVLEICDSFI